MQTGNCLNYTFTIHTKNMFSQGDIFNNYFISSRQKTNSFTPLQMPIIRGLYYSSNSLVQGESGDSSGAL